MTYELFYNPNTAQHLKQAQIAEIDSRIAKLEQLVGFSSGDNVDSLVSFSSHSNYHTRDSIQFICLRKNFVNTKKKNFKQPSNMPSSSIVALVSRLEKQIAVLSQPRHLDMISRRVKLVNSELEKLNELKAGKRGENNNNAGYGTDQANAGAISDNMDEKVKH